MLDVLFFDQDVRDLLFAKDWDCGYQNDREKSKEK